MLLLLSEEDDLHVGDVWNSALIHKITSVSVCLFYLFIYEKTSKKHKIVSSVSGTETVHMIHCDRFQGHKQENKKMEK